jgi:acyl-CoA thioesterase I
MFLQICFYFLLLQSSETHSATIRITCIGDSITKLGACATISYSHILQDLYGSMATVTNAGVSARTMLKSGLCYRNGEDCSYWNSHGWKIALESQPNIVTIMLGTNDARSFNWEGVQHNSGDDYALDYVDMIKHLRLLQPRPEIYLLIPPPLYDPYPFDMNATVINEIFPKLIRDIAMATETQVIDIYAAFREAEASYSTLSCDGCHPTSEGHKIIAETIYKALKMPMKKSKKSRQVHGSAS